MREQLSYNLESKANFGKPKRGQKPQEVRQTAWNLENSILLAFKLSARADGRAVYGG